MPTTSSQRARGDRSALADGLISTMAAIRRSGRLLGRAPGELSELTGAQIDLVRLVRRRPGVSVAEAAAELRVAPNTVSTLVAAAHGRRPARPHGRPCRPPRGAARADARDVRQKVDALPRPPRRAAARRRSASCQPAERRRLRGGRSSCSGRLAATAPRAGVRPAMTDAPALLLRGRRLPLRRPSWRSTASTCRSSRARSSACSARTARARRRRSGSLNTLLPLQEGRIEVLGYDVRRSQMAVRRLLGYVPQQLSIEAALTGRENVTWFARLFDVPRRERKERVADALERDGARRRRRPARRHLLGRHGPPARAGAGARQPARSCSCSTSRRSGSTRSPATASGSGSRSCARRPGMTVLLTTHYMEEAELLCDRVALMHLGHDPRRWARRTS